jgi:alpha-L-rhamnosidase
MKTKNLLRKLILLAVAVPSAAVFGGTITPERLRCEYLDNPLGIDVVEPRLSWELRANDENARGLRQNAYQVQVASSPGLLVAGKIDLWDSGKVESDETIGIAYAGEKLRSRDRCHWRVRVWDQDGRPSAWSEPALWTMGLLDSSDWQAKWIGDAAPAPPDSPPHRGYRSGPDERGEQPKWVAIDLGRGTAIDGVRLYGTRLVQRGVGDVPGYLYPLRYRIEVAAKRDFSDAKAIVVGDSQDVPNPGCQPTTCRFPRTAARFVRLWVSRFRCDENDNYGFALAELKVLDGERNVARDAEVFALDAEESDYWSPAKLTDGDIYWHHGGPVTPMVPPRLRKEFSLAKEPKRVTVYASALGLYELRINGQRVGDRELAPEWTDYHQIVQYQTYDVTGLLKQGCNAVAAQLADGWYAGRVGMTQDYGPKRLRGVYGRKPRFLMQLSVEFADGSSETIVTDESWKSTLEGPLRMADLYDGVTYDARRELPGWDRPGFDDSSWRPVEVDAGVEAELVAQRNEPVRVLHELKPRSLHKLKNGAWLFDLGQNMVGRVRLRVRGKEGAVIRVRHAEMLAPDGGLYVANLRGAFPIDRYTLKGDPDGEVFEPRFTQHGFRYVEVAGLEERPSVDDLTGRVFHSAAEQLGRFESSSTLVNRIWESILWTQRGNHVSVITDCPQRDERLGWLGSLEPFAHTACYNMDVSALFLKVCRDFRLAQSEDGHFPNLAPNVLSFDKGAPAWADAGVSAPWTGYVHFANRRLLEENYAAGCRFVDGVCERSPELISTERGFGDWLNGDRVQLEGYPETGGAPPIKPFATAYFAHSAETLANMARVLGRTADEKKYAELAASIRRAFQERFVSPDGVVEGDTQGGYALSLHYGMLPAAQRPAAVDNLVESIRAYDDRLSTGIITTHRMLLELSRGGRNDLAYQLFESRRCPSWGFMIENGATTIWERWDSWVPGRESLGRRKATILQLPQTTGFQTNSMNSFNHQEFASVGEWMYRVILGIEPDESQPGYKHFFIRPQPGGSLTYARGSLDSVRGKIAVDWRRAGDALTLEVTIPPNTSATVTLPEGFRRDIALDGTPAKGPTMELSSGCYQLCGRAGSK